MLRKSYIRTAHKNYISQVLEAKHGKLFSQLVIDKLFSQLVIAIYAGLLQPAASASCSPRHQIRQ